MEILESLMLLWISYLRRNSRLGCVESGRHNAFAYSKVKFSILGSISLVLHQTTLGVLEVLNYNPKKGKNGFLGRGDLVLHLSLGSVEYFNLTQITGLSHLVLNCFACIWFAL